MTIDKAIKHLETLGKVNRPFFISGEQEAIKLGIEALKGIKKVRKTLEPYVTALLLGETEE